MHTHTYKPTRAVACASARTHTLIVKMHGCRWGPHAQTERERKRAREREGASERETYHGETLLQVGANAIDFADQHGHVALTKELSEMMQVELTRRM